MTRSFKEPVFLVSTEFRLNERLAAKAIEIARATVERARGSSPPAPLFPAIEEDVEFREMLEKWVDTQEKRLALTSFLLPEAVLMPKGGER
jgi:hypothetical protein